MHRVRLLVLWIMMIAVPFQGYAAAAMLYCGPGHAGATAAVSAEPSVAHDHAQHPHGDGHGHPHQEAKPPANDDGGQSVSAAQDTQHKCSTCGACHATALTSTLQLAVFHDLPHADLAEPAVTMATLAPRVLDKPPRA